jgi:hypothetical protein
MMFALQRVTTNIYGVSKMEENYYMHFSVHIFLHDTENYH